jgi:uncharacterized protein (DUF885 family)
VKELNRAPHGGAVTVRVVAWTGVVALLSTLLTGCASTGRRIPSGADSVVANMAFGAILDAQRRFQLTRSTMAASWSDAAVIPVPQVSLDDAKLDAAFARSALQALDEVDVEALRQDDYVTWLMLRWDMEFLAGWPAFHWTRVTDASPAQSPLGEVVQAVATHPLRSAVEGERFLTFMRGVDTLVRQIRVGLAERADRGIRLWRHAVPRAATHVRSLVAPPLDSPFSVPEAFYAMPESTWQAGLASDVARLITDRINPALEELATYLDGNYLTDSPERPGLSQYPGGDAHYAALLRFRSTIDITPADAHAIGLREVTRFAVLAVEARAATDLPVDRDSLRATLRNDPRFSLEALVAPGRPGPGDLPSTIARLYDGALTALDSAFGGGAPVSLSIGVLPPRDSLTGPVAVYDAPGPLNVVARYRVNPDLVSRRSMVTLPALVFEDLMPGGHNQIARQRLNGSAPLARRLAQHAGFVRGWQAYGLGVADSLVGANDAVVRFGIRLHELALACGLVVDTGINAFGWDREASLAFLRAYLPFDDAELEREFVVEAVERPGWLSAGALGARELHGLRAWAQRELGDRFRLQDFHAELLRIGSVPLPVLGSHLERWIWEETIRQTTLGARPVR